MSIKLAPALSASVRVPAHIFDADLRAKSCVSPPAAKTITLAPMDTYSPASVFRPIAPITRFSQLQDQ